MVGSMARGACTKNSKIFRSMTCKSYHNDGSPADSKLAAGENGAGGEQRDSHVDGYGGAWWGPHHKTGIYYPRGQEKVMEDVPIGAGKCVEIVHCFSRREDVHVLGKTK